MASTEAEPLRTNHSGGLPQSRTFASAKEEQLHTPLVLVSRGWKPKAGAVLNESLQVGKLLGEGFMGEVYDVETKSGASSQRVMKVLKPSADDSMRQMLEREMVIGRALFRGMGEQTSDGSPTIPGYMLTQAAVREEVEGGKLLGIIIEKVNSIDVFKRLDSFGRSHPINIHYVREMLFQTLTALRAGQQTVGFYHRDLHAGNIMEHMPGNSAVKLQEIEEKADGTKTQKSVGLDQAKKDKVKLSHRGWKYRTEISDDVWQEVESDALGIEFKIIDFGWAVVTAIDDEEVAKLMAEQPPTAVGCGKCFCCITQPKQKLEDPANLTGPSEKNKLEGSSIPKLGFNTMIYHNIWKGSTDCYRLLSSVAAILDGRLWHARDREAVLQLQDLLYKSSGVYIRMRFTDKDESNQYKVKKFGAAWKARQIMRMTRGWANVGWSMLFPSDPGYSLDSALGHPFLKQHASEQKPSAAATAATSSSDGTAEAPVNPSDVELVTM